MLGVDGRSGWMRRWKDVIEDHLTDYGGDISYPRMTLLRHQATALVKMEMLTAKMADGKESFEEAEQFNRYLGNVRRTYELLGVDRIAKPISNGVLEHFASHPNGRSATNAAPDGAGSERDESERATNAAPVAEAAE
jgi:hypothetical protein